MATLLDLKQIYANTSAPEPILEDYPDAPSHAAALAAWQSAHDLLAKFEVAVWRRANHYLDAPANDTTPGKVKVGWSSRAADSSASMALTMLRLALGSDAARNATSAQIFSQTDSQLENIVDRLIPLFAEGVLVSR